MTEDTYRLRPIGYVRGERADPIDDHWDAIASHIELDSGQFGPDTVAGLDAIDGTPVLDIKPVMSGFLARGPFAEPDWAREIMEDYWA